MAKEIIETIREKEGFIIDMNGVLYHGNKLLPGVIDFVEWLKSIDCHSEESIIIGDRMDTDIIAGIESDIDTLHVLSGITGKSEIDKFAFQPIYILEGVSEIIA